MRTNLRTDSSMACLLSESACNKLEMAMQSNISR